MPGKRSYKGKRITSYFGKCRCPPAKKTSKQRQSAKLRDKKINTLVEKRMVEISKKQIAKERLNNQLREYWYAAGMNRSQNLYSPGRPIYFDGHANKIGTIDKTDVNQILNDPEPADPDLFVDASGIDADGAQQGMLTETIMGRRQTDKVKISGFSLGLKALFRAVQVLRQDHQIIGGVQGDEVPPQQPPNVQRQLETVVLKYAIVGVLRPENILEDPADPLPAEMLRYPTWGYSSSLDTTEKANEVKWIKKRVFLSGELKCNLSNARHKDFTVEKYVKLKSPLEVSYLPNEQNGQQTSDWSFYVVTRTNVPSETTIQDGVTVRRYSEFAPLITAYTKTHYHE